MSRRSLKKRQQILSIVATDATFERAEARGERVWLGKCLHCNAHLTIAANGDPVSSATVEHIIPRTHGGTNDPRNLGLACGRCNGAKSRHDRKAKNDPRRLELLAALQAKRQERWREPIRV